MITELISNYFFVVSALAVSDAIESVAIVVSTAIVVSAVTAVESADSSAGLLVHEAKATIPATNARANIFFISWV